MFAYGPQGMGQPTRQFVGHPMVPLKQPMALGQPMGQPMALNQPLSQATHFMPQQAAMPISRQPMTSSFAVLPRATSPLRPQSPRLQLSTSCSMLRSPEPSPRLVAPWHVQSCIMLSNVRVSLKRKVIHGQHRHLVVAHSIYIVNLKFCVIQSYIACA